MGVSVYGQQSTVSGLELMTDDWQLATADWRSTTGDWRPATGDRRPATGDRRPATGDGRLSGLRDQSDTNGPSRIAITIPTRPTASAPANPTANGFAPTPLKTLKLVFSPTAAMAVPRRIRDAQ